MMGQSTCLARCSPAPAFLCLMMMACGFIALRLAAVSAIVSPLEVELLEISSLMTFAPRFFAAISKLLSVRVEFSKNAVMIILSLRLWGGVVVE